MLHRIIGRAGSGKSEYILSLLREAVGSGKDCVLLVPEQQSLEAERLLCTALGDTANMRCEVLNFERLPERIAREYGSLARTYIDDSGRDLLMSVVLGRLSGNLSEYGRVCGDVDFIRRMIAAVGSFKSAGITPDGLREAAERVSGESGGRLSAKLSDLAAVYEEYDRSFPEGIYDSCDSLSILADGLPSTPFFAGKTVFADGFYNFTFQEKKLLDRIIAQSDDVYISFTADFDDDSGIFDSNNSCARSLALKNSPYEDISLPSNLRAADGALGYLEKNMWNDLAGPYGGDSGSIRVVECESVFDQAEAVCSEIMAFVRAGCRFREIAVSMRTADSQCDIIAAMAQKHGIPVVVSSKTPVVTQPFFAFVLASLECACTDFLPSSVKKYVKSGFCGLGVRESDLVLKYIDVWNIRGRKSYEEEWTMHPEGYRDGLDGRSAAVLRSVNAARSRISASLSALCEDMASPSLTVGTALRALWRHVTVCGCAAGLRASADTLRKGGDEDGALRVSQLWKIFVGLCDQLYAVCPDEKVTAERFAQLFRIAAEEKSVGAIPASADAVTVGSAELMRVSGIKHMIMIGVNDGVFPAAPPTDALFDDSELVLMEGLGFDIGKSTDRTVNEERVIFYTAACRPSETLTLVYPVSDLSSGALRCSVGVMRVRSLFPSVKTVRFGDRPEDLFFSRRAVAERLYRLPDDAAARKILAEKGMLPAALGPISDPHASVRYESDTVRLSPNRMDTYAYCAFSYYGRYLLGLKGSRKAKIDRPEIGVFIHSLLENFVRGRVAGGIFSPLDEPGIKSWVDEFTSGYMSRLGIDCAAPGGRRMKYAFDKLRLTAVLLLENICGELAESEFVPAAFELGIGMGESGAQGITLRTETGVTVTLSGIADRVDVMKKNGKTYIRVIDYKTGKKQYDKRAVENGIDLQMLYYLFALCAADKSGNTLPAGVLYVPAKLPKIDGDDAEDAERMKRTLEKKFRRSGLLIDDEQILTAMEKLPGERFLPVRKNKNGEYSATSSLADLETLGRLEEKIMHYIAMIGRCISEGGMDVSPLELDGAHTACAFCELGPVCRLSDDGGLRRSANTLFSEAGK